MPYRGRQSSSKAVFLVRYQDMVVRKREYLLSMAMGIILVLLVTSLLSINAEGAITDKTVLGIVNDQAGQPLSGADVTVEIWGGYWPDQAFFRTSQSTVTDSWGNYEVTINSNYWDPHNAIKVIVSYGSSEKTHDVEADGDTYQVVNVSINPSIPEYGGFLGLLAMMVGGMVPVMVLLTRKRKLMLRDWFGQGRGK